MKPRTLALLRFVVIGVAGYFCLATSAEQDWFVEAAHVEIPLAAQQQDVRVAVVVDADELLIVAPQAISLTTASGQTWLPGQAGAPADSGDVCTGYRAGAIFCEVVSEPNQTLVYTISLPGGAAGDTAVIEAIGGGTAERIVGPSSKLGVSITVLP